ncbi:pancreatic triacylglycerol lipase-like [Cylas formicarius]|uniref:pancreatic triacylglycerol lipase-like n=1 Tax=Cylas formicarius TaxID=197179 RepID=UPI002958D734|nr:pancreatic triacylglycerol lipase-like [Cylas formicarius]
MLVNSIRVVLAACLVATFGDAQLMSKQMFRFPVKLQERLRAKLSKIRQRNTKLICYDIVGCFNLPHKNSPLQKTPEDPRILRTKFYLFTRKINFSTPEILYYDDDGKSLSESSFNVFNPTKLLIHGYMSKWNEKGAVRVADAYLKLYDCNVILMDWRMGARGPQYTAAAANTEVVGRELGTLLLTMVEKGLDPANIHLIGFSLGAHVAGTASETLKSNGHLVGRITGLDAASPLFRNDHFREKHKKLDSSDAKYVDIIHTDSSPFVTDGFGIWEPIGHVDFFPNGGQEQPGCRDPRSSIVVTHLEGTLNRETACSHVRAFRLFTETLLNKANNQKCRFIAFSCPGGLQSFNKGRCFPQLSNGRLDIDPAYRTDEIGQFGEDGSGGGVMYFATRDSSPYCGTQLQVSAHISQKTGPVRGVLQMQMNYLQYSLDVQMRIESADLVMTGAVMNAIVVAEYDTLTPESVKTIKTKLSYFDLEMETGRNQSSYAAALYVDKIIVKDMLGNSWQFCKKGTLVRDINGTHHDLVGVNLSDSQCS